MVPEGVFLKIARIFFVYDDEVVAPVIEWRLKMPGYNVCEMAKKVLIPSSLKKKSRISSY